MSVKKTSSPFSSGAESLEPLSQKETKKAGKTESSFEAALSDVEGQLDGADGTSESSSAERTALNDIASNSDLGTPEGAFGAVKESAGFLVKTRLDEKFSDSEQGEKLTEDLSDYIARDPFMHRKLLGILQRLKE